MAGTKQRSESQSTSINDVFNLFHVTEISPSTTSIPWVILYYGCELRIVAYFLKSSTFTEFGQFSLLYRAQLRFVSIQTMVPLLLLLSFIKVSFFLLHSFHQ